MEGNVVLPKGPVGGGPVHTETVSDFLENLSLHKPIFLARQVSCTQKYFCCPNHIDLPKSRFDF